MERLLGISVAIVLGGAPACLLSLDSEPSCGDGFFDEDRAGEECDPSVPESYEDGCLGTAHPMGEAQCDPITCELLNDADLCAVCGDGVVDSDEECDGDSLGGAVCPGGNGALQCSPTCRFDFSECDACGNGVVDEGEECDYRAGGGFVTPRECAGTNVGTPDEVPALSSPVAGKPYSSGQTSRCLTDCRFDRVGCGYCGDDSRDEPTAVQDGVTSPAEWCDGALFDDARLVEAFGPLCEDPTTQRPTVACGDDCRSFEELASGCCLKRNATCPGDSDGLRCCHEALEPDDIPCYTSASADGTLRSLCK